MAKTQNWADASDDFSLDFTQSPNLGPTSPQMQGKPPPVGHQAAPLGRHAQQLVPPQQLQRGPVTQELNGPPASMAQQANSTTADIPVQLDPAQQSAPADANPHRARIDQANQTLNLSHPVPEAPPFIAYITHIHPDLVEEDMPEFFQHKDVDMSGLTPNGIDWNETGEYNEMYVECDSLGSFLDLLFLNGEDIMEMAIKVDIYPVDGGGEPAPAREPSPVSEPPPQAQVSQPAPAPIQQQPRQQPRQPPASSAPATNGPDQKQGGGRFNFKKPAGFQQRALPQTRAAREPPAPSSSGRSDPFGGAPPRKIIPQHSPSKFRNGIHTSSSQSSRPSGASLGASSPSKSGPKEDPFGGAKPRECRPEDFDRPSPTNKRGGGGGYGNDRANRFGRPPAIGRPPASRSPNADRNQHNQQSQPPPRRNVKATFTRPTDDGEDDFAPDGTYRGARNDAPPARQYNNRSYNSGNRFGGNDRQFNRRDNRGGDRSFDRNRGGYRGRARDNRYNDEGPVAEAAETAVVWLMDTRTAGEAAGESVEVAGQAGAEAAARNRAVHTAGKM